MFREMTQLLNRLVEAVDEGDTALILLIARRYTTLHRLVHSRNQ